MSNDNIEDVITKTTKRIVDFTCGEFSSCERDSFSQVIYNMIRNCAYKILNLAYEDDKQVVDD